MSSGLVESQIQELLNESSLDSKNLPWPTICRIPKSMNREDDPKPYVPELVSIGPYHYTDTTLALTQKHKVGFFVSLSKRLYGGSSGDIIENDLKKAADKMVDKVRECYSDGFNSVGDSDFSWMIVLDACFILELFRLYYRHRRQSNYGFTATTTKGKEDYKDDEPIFRTRWVVGMLRMDLIKMENQLPFFVLEQFYDLINTSSSSSREGDEESAAAVSLTEYAANFFAPLLPSGNNIIHADIKSKSSHVHLLDFLHKILNPELPGKSIENTASTSISISGGDLSLTDGRTVDSVSNLTNYGVRFKRGNGGLLDFQFHEEREVLEIPYLEIDKNTIILFRNLLAYEVSDTRVPSYFTSYITFVSQLLSSPRDVTKLRNVSILKHSLVSDKQLVIEIANCFSEVKSGYDPQKCYLNMQFKKLDSFKNRSVNKWLYILKKEYFDDPGKAGQTLAYLFGVLGFYLAVIQTIFTILPYTRAKN